MKQDFLDIGIFLNVIKSEKFKKRFEDNMADYTENIYNMDEYTDECTNMDLFIEAISTEDDTLKKNVLNCIDAIIKSGYSVIVDSIFYEVFNEMYRDVNSDFPTGILEHLKKLIEGDYQEYPMNLISPETEVPEVPEVEEKQFIDENIENTIHEDIEIDVKNIEDVLKEIHEIDINDILLNKQKITETIRNCLGLGIN